MPAFLYRLPQNVVVIFRGKNLAWHLAAIAMTVILVTSGADWSYYQATQHEGLIRLAWPAIRLGTVLPVLGPLFLVLFGWMARSRRILAAGWAIAQAVLLGYLISCVYKAFTGRLPPPHHWHGQTPAVANAVDSSHGFQFGFWRGGIFWGWPSSHTTIAFSMMLCLIALFPRNKLLAVIALLYAFYVGFAVSMTIHWLSEFVAGAVIGSVIGTVVGRSFRDKLAQAPVSGAG